MYSFLLLHRICNWPSAITCVENPDAVLPDHASSDRAPPKSVKQRPRDPAFNTINVDSEYEDRFQDPAPVASVPSFSHGNVPSKREALERERQLTSEYPLFKVKWWENNVRILLYRMWHTP